MKCVCGYQGYAPLGQIYDPSLRGSLGELLGGRTGSKWLQLGEVAAQSCLACGPLEGCGCFPWLLAFVRLDVAIKQIGIFRDNLFDDRANAFRPVHEESSLELVQFPPKR